MTKDGPSPQPIAASLLRAISRFPSVFKRLVSPRRQKVSMCGSGLNSSKLKRSADNNLKFDENSIKFYKHIENTVGKGEIACFRQCFKRLVSQGDKRCDCVGMG